MSFSEMLIGKREQISWEEETTYGIAVTPTVIVGLNAKVEPDFDQNWQEILSAGADDRYISNRVKGPLTLPFTLIFTPVNWNFLKYCGYSLSEAGSDPYTHTFTLANTIMSFTLEWAKRASTDHVLTLSGCVVKSATISFAKSTGAGEGMLVVSLSCVAQGVIPGSSTTSLSEITATPFQWKDVKATIGTSEVVEVNNGEIAIDNGIDESDSRYCNATLDREIGEPIPKVHRITGRINVNLKDSTFYDFWEAAATISGTNKLEFIRGTDDDLVGTFAGFKLAKGVAPTNLEGVTNVDLPFTAESWSSLIATDSEANY